MTIKEIVLSEEKKKELLDAPKEHASCANTVLIADIFSTEIVNAANDLFGFIRNQSGGIEQHVAIIALLLAAKYIEDDKDGKNLIAVAAANSLYAANELEKDFAKKEMEGLPKFLKDLFFGGKCPEGGYDRG